MSDEQTTGGIRRFGRRDRKRSLDTRGPLFPPDEIAEDSGEAGESGTDEAPAIELVEPPPVPMPQVAVSPAVVPTTKKKAAPIQGKQVAANLFTLLFLVATIGLVVVIGMITANPYTPLNPFPPFTPLPIVITATFLPPTETPIGTAIPTATFTPVAVDQSGTTQTSFTFILVGEQPIYTPNANDKACNWSSIAGTVTDGNGAALDGYRVHISGNGLDETVFSGAALTFGAGGFELFLNGTPQVQTYSVELLDPQSRPLSTVYTVTTRDKCDQNVVVLQFKPQ